MTTMKHAKGEKMKEAHQWISRAFMAIAILIFAGCATPLGSNMTADPEIGYWLAAYAGNSRQQDVHAARVASKEFVRRATGIPSTLHELRAYRARLQAPVEIRASFPADSPDMRGITPAEIAKIEDYAALHRELATITGSQHAKEWADELAKLTPVMRVLEDRVEQAVRGGEAKLKQDDVTGAEAAWREARKLDRDGVRVGRLEREIMVAKNKGTLETLVSEIGANFLKRAADMQKKFGAVDSTEANVAGCLAVLAAADKAVLRYRESLRTVDGQQFSADSVEKALLAPERDIAELRGKCWGEQVRLLAARKKYWLAHQYADEKAGEAAFLAEHRKAVLVAPLVDSYRQLLLPAVTELVNMANSQLDRDAYGTALTLCRMAEEVVQFGRDHQLHIADDVAVWEKRCVESRRDAQKKIASAVQRRLLVGDFSPLTRENQRLSSKVLARCAELLSDSATNRSWSARYIVVEKLGEKAHEGDSVIECNVPEFLIVDAPPVELERAVIKVGRDIREIPNPQYSPEKKDVPRTLFSQEVYLYQTIRRQHQKKARLQASLTSTNNNRKKNLLAIDVEFGEGKTKLDGVQMTSVEEMLDVPFLGPVRIAGSHRSLTVDPWPKAVPVSLSSNIEITEALQRYAADRISEAIIASAGSYPVDVLAAEAVRRAKLGNKAEAANSWGQCLEYCLQLCGGKEDSTWLVQKDLMLGRIPELCRTIWKNCDAEALQKMPALWSEATRSALDAAAQAQ